MMMTLKFSNFTKAWEGINEMFITSPGFLFENGAMRYSRAWYIYNTTIEVDTPVLNPEFDFGTHFNYTFQKWRILIGNYICAAELQSLKQVINSQFASKKIFNVPYKFHNKHSNGKECLLSMVISRRPDSTVNLTLFIRASEVTKRLAVDFLLAQRLGEYLLGDQKFSVTFHITQMFNDDTVLLMYYAHNPKRVHRILRETNNEISIALLKRLKEMLVSTEEQMGKYKVHLRAFKVIRPDLYTYPTTLAKDCKLPL